MTPWLRPGEWVCNGHGVVNPDLIGVGSPAPCVICRRSALCRSPRGVVCHKACPEGWLDARQDQAARLAEVELFDVDER